MLEHDIEIKPFMSTRDVVINAVLWTIFGIASLVLLVLLIIAES